MILALCALSVVALATVGIGGASKAAPGRSNLPPATTPVTLGDLTEYQDVPGTLGYGPTTSVVAPSGAGIITWLAKAGSVVPRGKALYAIDNRPVTLLYGAIPSYRALKVGDRGQDVLQLERNLVALGYRHLTVDDRFTAATEAAVKRWQGELSAQWQADPTTFVTGTVKPSEVVYAQGPERVATQTLALGAAATGTVLTLSASSQVVTVTLPVDQASTVHSGLSVTVTFPDGGQAAGRVRSLGPVVSTIQSAATASSSAPAAGGSAAGGNSQAGIPVTIGLGTPVANWYEGSSVTVRIVSQQKKGVLSVPVEALLALREGGFGLEIVTNGTSRIVAVQVGMFAQGRAEVLPGAVARGDSVGVAG